MARPIPRNTHHKANAGYTFPYPQRNAPANPAPRPGRQDFSATIPSPNRPNDGYAPLAAPAPPSPPAVNLTVSRDPLNLLGQILISIPLNWRIFLAALSAIAGVIPATLQFSGVEIPLLIWVAGLLLVGLVFYMGATTHGMRAVETSTGIIQLLAITVLCCGGILFGAICIVAFVCALLIWAGYLAIELLLFAADFGFALVSVLFGRK